MTPGSNELRFDETRRYAGFWRRVAASIIDIIIYMPVSLILLYLVQGSAVFQSDPGFGLGLTFSRDHLWGIFVNTVLPIIITVFFWVKFMGTPGKLLLDCQVLDAQTGKPLTMSRAVLRYFAYILSMLPLMLGFLWVGWDRRKQGFHDKIAGSVVVITDESGESIDDSPKHLKAQMDKEGL